MSDRPTDPADHDRLDRVDERVRTTLLAQLRAEEARLASGVVASSRPAGSPRGWAGGRAGRLLIAAAAIVVVGAVGVGLAVARRGQPQSLEAIDAGPTTTGEAVTDSTPGTTARPMSLEAWAGMYEWVEFVEGDPGSDQAVVNDLVLDEPTGEAATGVTEASEPTELTGTFTRDGFQNATEATVVARPVEGGVAIEVVAVEGPTSLRPGDVAFTLTGDPARPVTTIGALIPLLVDQPPTGTYFLPVGGGEGSVEDGAAGEVAVRVPEPDPLPDPDPDAGYTLAGGYAVAVLADDTLGVRFVAIDLATGEVAATFATTFPEASWYSPIELTADGDAAYLTQAFEDYWFSCDSVLPTVLRLDLDPAGGGQPVEIGEGIDPRVSPDGTRLAYLTASDCVPDPQDPGNWVIAPLDTIVVRDLATGAEARHTVPGIVEGVAAGGDYLEAELRGLVWLGDDRLGVSGGEILAGDDLAPTGDRVPTLVEAVDTGRVIGYEPATGSVLVARTTHPDGRLPEVVVQAIEVTTGERFERLAPVQSWEGHAVQHGLDADGRYLLSVEGDDLVLPDGTTVPLAEREATVVSIDW